MSDNSTPGQNENFKKEIFTIKEKQQLSKSIRMDIKKEVFQWVKKWGGLILTGVAILGFIGFNISLNQIYKKVTNKSAEVITKSITEKFAEPNIKSTLNEVAISEARTIIKDVIYPEITKIQQSVKKEYGLLSNEIKEIKKEIVLFKDYMKDSKIKISKEFETTVKQVMILENRNKLAELADKAIAEGDSRAFEQLKDYIDNPIEKELLNAAKAEALRVKKFYIAMTRIKGVDFTYVDPEGKELKEEAIPTEILLRALSSDSDWRVRTRAAQLLKNRKEKEVPEALIEAVSKDLRLDVRKVSLDSFESTTGFQSPDVLDYEPAIKWWGENKQKVEKRLEEQD